MACGIGPSPLKDTLKKQNIQTLTQVGRELRERTAAKAGLRRTTAVVCHGHPSAANRPGALAYFNGRLGKRTTAEVRHERREEGPVQNNKILSLEVEDKVNVECLVNPAMDYHACGLHKQGKENNSEHTGSFDRAKYQDDLTAR